MVFLIFLLQFMHECVHCRLVKFLAECDNGSADPIGCMCLLYVTLAGAVFFGVRVAQSTAILHCIGVWICPLSLMVGSCT